jgi:hypothetical protein
MKAKEMRLRRAAHRQGMALVKSKRRSADAIGFGRWCLVSKWEERAVGVVAGGFGLIDAPASSGGLERYASWMSLDAVATFPAQDVK